PRRGRSSPRGRRAIPPPFMKEAATSVQNLEADGRFLVMLIHFSGALECLSEISKLAFLAVYCAAAARLCGRVIQKDNRIARHSRSVAVPVSTRERSTRRDTRVK